MQHLSNKNFLYFRKETCMIVCRTSILQTQIKYWFNCQNKTPFTTLKIYIEVLVHACKLLIRNSMNLVENLIKSSHQLHAERCSWCLTLMQVKLSKQRKRQNISILPYEDPTSSTIHQINNLRHRHKFGPTSYRKTVSE